MINDTDPARPSSSKPFTTCSSLGTRRSTPFEVVLNRHAPSCALAARGAGRSPHLPLRSRARRHTDAESRSAAQGRVHPGLPPGTCSAKCLHHVGVEPQLERHLPRRRSGPAALHLLAAHVKFRALEPVPGPFGDLLVLLGRDRACLNLLQVAPRTRLFLVHLPSSSK